MDCCIGSNNLTDGIDCLTESQIFVSSDHYNGSTGGSTGGSTDLIFDHNDKDDWMSIIENDNGSDSIKKTLSRCEDMHNNLPNHTNDQSDDIRNIDDFHLLERASMSAKNIKFQFNKNYDANEKSFIEWITTSLERLIDICFELANRNEQPIIVSTVQQKKTDHLFRNSYKFCEYGYMCKFTYDNQQKCYAQHFVYNLVHMDLIEALNYITTNYSNNSMCLNELKTSINTITFVINHMYNEMSNLKNKRHHIYQNCVDRLIKFKSDQNVKKRKSSNYN
jgi:hypothetical protein